MKTLNSILATNHYNLSAAYAYKAQSPGQNRFSSLNPSETLLLKEEQPEVYSSSSIRYPYKSYSSSSYVSLAPGSGNQSDSSEDETPSVPLQKRKASQFVRSKTSQTPAQRTQSDIPRLNTLQPTVWDSITHQYPELNVQANNCDQIKNSDTESSSSTTDSSAPETNSYYDTDSNSDYSDAEELYTIYA